MMMMILFLIFHTFIYVYSCFFASFISLLSCELSENSSICTFFFIFHHTDPPHIYLSRCCVVYTRNYLPLALDFSKKKTFHLQKISSDSAEYNLLYIFTFFMTFCSFFACLLACSSCLSGTLFSSALFLSLVLPFLSSHCGSRNLFLNSSHATLWDSREHTLSLIHWPSLIFRYIFSVVLHFFVPLFLFLHCILNFLATDLRRYSYIHVFIHFLGSKTDENKLFLFFRFKFIKQHDEKKNQNNFTLKPLSFISSHIQDVWIFFIYFFVQLFFFLSSLFFCNKKHSVPYKKCVLTIQELNYEWTARKKISAECMCWKWAKHGVLSEREFNHCLSWMCWSRSILMDSRGFEDFFTLIWVQKNYLKSLEFLKNFKNVLKSSENSF